MHWLDEESLKNLTLRINLIPGCKKTLYEDIVDSCVRKSETKPAGKHDSVLGKHVETYSDMYIVPCHLCMHVGHAHMYLQFSFCCEVY